MVRGWSYTWWEFGPTHGGKWDVGHKHGGRLASKIYCVYHIKFISHYVCAEIK